MGFYIKMGGKNSGTTTGRRSGSRLALKPRLDKPSSVVQLKASSTGVSEDRSRMEARARLEAMDCDPLEFTAKVMMGQELQGEHPFLVELLNKLDRFAKAFRDKNMIVEARIVDTTISSAKNIMGHSETDKTQRLQAATNLLGYAYPKLRSIDVKIAKPAETVEEMNDDELIAFLRADNENSKTNKNIKH